MFRFLVFICLCVSLVEGKEISVIWQIAPENSWEHDWVREILQGVEYKEIEDGSFQCVVDDAIIVTSQPHKLENYLVQFKENNCRFGIIHLSDECFTHPVDCYKDAAFVYRNYWHKKWLNDAKVNCFPLGYKSGFWQDVACKNLKQASSRTYIWSFAGQVNKSTRQEMVFQMKKIPSYFVYEIQQFADPNSLRVEDYRNLLLETVFVPCPRGWWNLDSFRIYEALECGCIPIVEKEPLDYFTKFLGDHPFLSVSSWDEAPLLIEQLLENPDELERRRKECASWWLEYKHHLQQNIADTVKMAISH